MAQTAPALPEDRLPEIPSRNSDDIQIPELSPLSPKLPEPPSPRFTPNTIQVEDTIVVSEINFIGNEAIPSELLDRLAVSYLDKEIPFSALLQLQSDITNFYIQRGYLTSGANLFVEENQYFDPQAASMTFEITEGQVEDVRIKGAQRLERYVRRRIERAISPAFNQPKLEEAIRLLQVDPLIESISAELTSGTRSSSNILILDIEPSPSFYTSVTANNTRSPLTGRFEQNVEIQASNLLSLAESISVGYSRTEGSDQYGIEFSVPTNEQGGQLGFEFAKFDSQITQEPFDAFDIESQSSIYKAAYSHPVRKVATESKVEELSIGISAARLESSSSIEDIPFPLSPGANADGQTRINEIGLFQEYQRLSSQSVAIARSEVGIGLELLDSTTGEGFDDDYFLWRGQAAWLQQVGNNRLLIKSDIQLTGDKLVPLTQFSLGQLRAAQGFKQFSLLSDSGISASIDFQIPLAEDPISLAIVPFFEAGFGWNNGDARTLQNDLLVAPGVGLQLDVGGVSANFNYAVPLNEMEGAAGSRLGFQLGYQTTF